MAGKNINQIFDFCFDVSNVFLFYIWLISYIFYLRLDLVESNFERPQPSKTPPHSKDEVMKFATKLQDLGIEQLKKITPKTAQLAAIIRIFEAVRVLISNQNNID
jgi:hypothetical protein